MKICFLTNELSSKGGWGRYSVSLLEQLSANGVDCCALLAENSKENVLPQIENYKVLPPVFGSRVIKLFILIKNYRTIRKIIKSSDIIHVLIEPYSPIAYVTKQNKPLIITLHGTYAVYAFNNFYSRIIYKKIYQSARRLICISNFTKQEVLKRVKVGNITVINNGVDYEKFQITRPVLSQKNKIIISVGALMFRKGYHISIPAVAEVVKYYPNLKYYIVGNHHNQNYFNQLILLVKEFHLKNNIIFQDNISDLDLIQLYHQSDLFILTPVNIKSNKFEGLGLVYLEANACGLPVIGTLNCGAEDVITDGKNGFLVEQNNIAKTAEAILKILDNHSLALALGQNGQKRAKQMNWSLVVKRYLQIYQFK